MMEVNLSRSYMDVEYATQTQGRVQNVEPAKEEIHPSEQTIEKEIGKEKEEVSPQELQNTTEDMTKWIQNLNTDIQFELHKETNQMMVRVVDTKENKVLREFPPHEFLDTVAKIREYVGMLLDKKI